VAADMVQDGLDNMRLNTNLSHSGCRCPSQIMNDPRLHRLGFLVGFLANPRNGLIQLVLGFAPARKTALPDAEHQVTAIAWRLRPDDSGCGCRQRYGVLAPVLGTFCRQNNNATVKVDFRPAQVCDLAFTLPGQN